MRIRKSVFVLLALLFIGCAQQHTTRISKETNHDTGQYPAASVSRVSKQPVDEIVVDSNGTLPLRQVLALTLIHNPELKVFSLETRATQARELQAGLWPNPEIDIEAENVGGTGELSGFDGAETTIQLSQLIELGNKSQKRRKVASLEKELAGVDYESKRLEVFSEATKAFISVLKAQEKLQLSNELLTLSEKSFETVTKRVDAGKDSPVEKTRASVVLANIKISNRQAKRDLEYASKQLASFWGQDKPLFREAAGDLYRIEPLPTLENLITQLKQNPEYARWETEIKKSRAVLDMEESRAIGDITIGAGVRRFNETNDNAFVFGVSIPLPVSDRNQGTKQEAVYNLAKSHQSQKAAWLKLQNEFNQTYQEFTNSFSQATSLKNEVLPAAIEMFNAATRAYQEGKVDYLNLLDAQRTLFDIKNEYIESLADSHTAKADIQRFIANEIEPVNISES
ncbi:MAG: TolC family protein [Phycisphaerae bacterium]|nr:TolC family protein [Phycisphaerae bacterium]